MLFPGSSPNVLESQRPSLHWLGLLCPAGPLNTHMRRTWTSDYSMTIISDLLSSVPRLLRIEDTVDPTGTIYDPLLFPWIQVCFVTLYEG